MAKRQRDDDYAPGRIQRGKSDPAASSPAARNPAGGRGAVACLQCRTRKSVCSLTGPACEGCLKRGEPDACSFQAMIWIDDPEDLPSRQLKRKVDRLEELLQRIAAEPRDETPPDLDPSQVPPDLDPSQVPPDRTRASSAPAAPYVAPPLPYDSIARDRAADTLTRALLNDQDVPEISALTLDASALSAELRQVEREHAPPLPFFNLPTPASLHAHVSPEDYEKTVNAVSPTLPQAQFALSAFFALANPLLRLVHAPTFLAQCDTFWRTGAMPEPTWLATYLTACGLGLLLSPDPGAGQQNVVPAGAAKELLARTWTDAGRRVLAANDALLQPTVESVRAFILILLWWVVDGARYVESSLSLSASFVSAVFDLQLNRDPKEVTPHVAPVEANIRRRLFWSLYTFESITRPMLGKSWQPFDENEISVAFPSDTLDGEPATPGATQSVLYEVGVLNFRISKVLTTRKGTPTEDVAQILAALKNFLHVHRDETFVGAMARYAYHRVHRFAARSGMTTAADDDFAVEVFADLLASIDSPEMGSNVLAPFILLRILAAAVTSAVDLEGMSFAQAGTIPFTHHLVELLHFLRSRAFVPKVERMVRRGVAILEHLLPRPEEPVWLGPSLMSDSASDFSLASSKLATPSTVSSAPEGYGVYPRAHAAVYQAQEYFSAHAAPLSFPAPAVAASQHASLMPPPSHGFSHQPMAVRTLRPTLSLHTTVAPPAPATKALTPVVVSPWIDAAITPSRYFGDYQWNHQL
ncbi:hypothetical protein JCM3770_006513 [Rhodotorula araucariae]